MTDNLIEQLLGGSFGTVDIGFIHILTEYFIRCGDSISIRISGRPFIDNEFRISFTIVGKFSSIRRERHPTDNLFFTYLGPIRISYLSSFKVILVSKNRNINRR